MEGVPLEASVRDSLLRTLFGTSNPDDLPLSWIGQSFSFHNGRSVTFFALVQLAGGPCGVLASIQAWILQALLALANSSYTDNHEDLKQLRQTVLSSALAKILWQAAACSRPSAPNVEPRRQQAVYPPQRGTPSENVKTPPKSSSEKQPQTVPQLQGATVASAEGAIPPTKGKAASTKPLPPSSVPSMVNPVAASTAPQTHKKTLTSTNIVRVILVTGSPQSVKEYLDSWRVVEVHSYDELFQLLYRHSQHVTTFGVVPFTCSVILTKTLEAIRAETDEIVLTGALKDCSQELVNLLLTGRAVGHLFDGDTDRDGLTLRGIRSPCEIGFLTEEEARCNIEVGRNYKHPLQPIWVLHGGMHYSVLVELLDRTERAPKTRHRFFWFPGGPRCRYYELEVDTDPELSLAEVDITDVAIMIDCLRTRWPRAKVLNLQELARQDSAEESSSGGSEENNNDITTR